MTPDHGSKIIATFQPTRTDDLSDLAPPIGYRTTWQYAWTMGDDDPFPGEVAWTTHDRNDPYGWVPDRDLAHRVEMGGDVTPDPEQIIADALHKDGNASEGDATDLAYWAARALRAAGLLVAPGEVPVPIDALWAIRDANSHVIRDGRIPAGSPVVIRLRKAVNLIPPSIWVRLDSAPSRATS